MVEVVYMVVFQLGPYGYGGEALKEWDLKR